MEPRQPSVAIVEDHLDTLDMYVSLFSMKGFAVHRARTARELIGVLRHNECPDAIVMDVGLPDGGGAALCRRLRRGRAFRDVPIFAVTGWLDQQHLLRQALFTDVLFKPVNPLTLLEAVCRGIHGRLTLISEIN